MIEHKISLSAVFIALKMRRIGKKYFAGSKSGASSFIVMKTGDVK